jgi:3-methyladenine DNA glycosylase AlkD
MGVFIEMYPEYVTELKRWARSKNHWMRRASAVSLIIPAKQGKYLHHICEIADILLLDQDDLAQKGYGWMLKAAGHIHQNNIFDFIITKKSVMPRTALRYAIEKMPKELKKKAMEKLNDRLRCTANNFLHSMKQDEKRVNTISINTIERS